MSPHSIHWPWYVAEFVVSERQGHGPVRHAIHSYLIWAASAENASINAKNLELALPARLRALNREENGRDDTEYQCLGLHDLATLHVDELENGIHLGVVHWPNDTPPPVRAMEELSIHAHPLPPG